MTAAQNVLNDGNGGTDTGAFPYALVAMLYDANIFGLDKDYAYPEGSNVSASRWDQITTLAKVLTRTHTHADGNTYDIWDAVQTILKWVLAQNVHLNDDEADSANYVAPKSS